ncbi:MAG: site-2 protease family protein [Methanocellales archaeon]|nr:site-2 protease family protein [Methanocellales archaeon]
MNLTIIALMLLGAYWIVIALLDKVGMLERHDISRRYDIVLMIRTKRGHKLLDKLSRPRKFWRGFASAGIALTITGLLLLFMIIWYLDYVVAVHALRYPLLLRGMFSLDFLHIWAYLGLIVAMVAHSYAHAILARVEGVRVKATSLLFAIVPLGISSELCLDKVATLSKIRILAGGVMANFMIALIAFTLFFAVLSAMSPIGNVMVTDVMNGSVADHAGIRREMVITQLNDVKIENAHDIYAFIHSVRYGDTITIHVVDGKNERTFDVRASRVKGLEIVDVLEGYPAADAGIRAGMRIVKINVMPATTVDLFMKSMNATYPGQNISVHVIADGVERIFNVTLAEPPHEFMGKGWLGVMVMSKPLEVLGIEVEEYPASSTLHFLQTMPTMLNRPMGWITLITLPFMGLTGPRFDGFTGLLIQFYQPVGWALPLGNGIFWIANSLFWIGYISFCVGALNCLPVAPLDGKHVFRDIALSGARLFTKDKERQERMSNAAVHALALLLFASIVFLFIAPYLVHLHR